MAELTLEQQQAIAIAKAKVRAKQAQQQRLDTEIQAQRAEQQERFSPKQEAPVEQLPEPSTRWLPENEYTNMLPENPITLGKGLVKGAYNAGVGVARTANAVGGAIGMGLGAAWDKVVPESMQRSPERIEAGRRNVAADQKLFQDIQLKPADKVDAVTMPAAEVATGAAIGGAAGKGLGYAGKLATTSFGAAAATPDQEGVVVGDKGMVGLDVTPEDDAATAQTKKFINLGADNILTTAAFDAGSKVGGVVFRTVRDAVNAMRGYRKLPVMEREYVSDIIEIGAGLGENPTRQQQIDAYQKLLDRTNQYHSKTYPMGPGMEDVTIEKDPISIMTEGLDSRNPTERARQIHLESLRASAKPGNAPKTTVALERPKTALDDSLQGVQETRGGNKAIEQTRENLQDRAMGEAVAEDMVPAMEKENLTAQQGSYQDVLEKDKTFGGPIKEAKERGLKLDINELERNKKSEIVQGVKEQRGIDANTRNAAYDEVSATGVQASPKLFNDAYAKAEPYVPQHIKDIIEKSDGTFGYLNNEVRPALSKAISAARDQAAKTGDFSAANALMEFRDNITGKQVDYIRKKAGGSAAARAAENANTENIRYSEKYNQGIGRELKQNEKNNSPKIAPIDFIEKGRGVVDSAVSNPNRSESIGQLKKILGPEKEGLVADTALAKATKDIQAGKGANFDKITSDLQDMAHNFGPEEQKRLEGFLSDVKAKKMSIDELEAKIPELQKASDDAKEKIFGEKFKGLFEKATGKRWASKENGYRAFQDMMDDTAVTADSKSSTLDRILEMSDDTDKKGLQAAWAKSAEEKLSRNSKDIQEFSPEFEAAGKKIFGDNPAFNSILEIKKEAQRVQRAQVRTGIQEFDRGKNQKAMSRAVQMVSTWAFGVLNPTAARIKTISSHLLNEYDSNPLAHEAIDNVLSNNQILRDNLKRMIDETATKVSPSEKQMMKRVALQLGLYNKREQTEMNFPELSKK